MVIKQLGMNLAKSSFGEAKIIVEKQPNLTKGAEHRDINLKTD